MFGGVVALDDVNLEVAAGEVVALAGDNGAGKSTVVKVITGVHKPSSGRLMVNGTEQSFNSPKDAMAAGIASVYQDLSLCDNLSAAANLFLGQEPRHSGWRGKLGMLDLARMHDSAQTALTDLGIRTLPSTDTRVLYLSGGQRQAVAIVRATLETANIVVLDEPTAALGIREREQVYALVNSLKDRGYGVVIVSHSIPEILRLANRVVILRLGQLVSELNTAELGDNAGDVIVSAITGSAGRVGVSA